MLSDTPSIRGSRLELPSLLPQALIEVMAKAQNVAPADLSKYESHMRATLS